MRATPYTKEQLLVSTLAPSALPRPHVPNYNLCIVIHATGHFLVTSVTKIVWPWELRASWSVSVVFFAEIAVSLWLQLLSLTVSRHSAISITRSSHQSVFATSLRSNLCQLSHRFGNLLFDLECTQYLEQRDGYFDHYRTVYVLSKFAQSVKQLRNWIWTVHVWQTCPRDLAGPHRKFIEYIRHSRIFSAKIYVISHNYGGYNNSFVEKVSGTELDILYLTAAFGLNLFYQIR